MKYIRTLEKLSELPKIGEYFKLYDGFASYGLKEYFETDNQGYIKVIDTKPNNYNKYVALTTKNVKLDFHQDLMDRKLTDAEIEKFEFDLTRNKYNL